jgi:hypothetical protein
LAAAAFPGGPSHAPRILSTRLHTPLGCIVIPPARHRWDATSATSLYLALGPDDVPKRCPPLTESPFCPPRVLLGAGRGQPRLGRRYPALFARIGSSAPPKPSRRLSSRVYGESLQVPASLLLEVGGSRRYLHNPCIGAWPYTPPRFLSASTRFFLRNIGLTYRSESFGSRVNFHTMQLQHGSASRGCRHSFMFRLLCSLDPQIAPTAVAHCPLGSRAVYTTQ